MNFEGFVNRVLDQIKEYLPESFLDAEFVVRQHEKLNNQYAALTIDNSKFAPVINLEDYFYDYEHDLEMKEYDRTLKDSEKYNVFVDKIAILILMLKQFLIFG